MSKIIVEGYEIETKEIVKITDAGHRRCGFIIHLIGPRKLTIDEPEPYDAMPSFVANINDRYRRLRIKIQEEWDKDKTDIKTFNL